MVSTRRRKRQASLNSDVMKKVKSPRPQKNRPKISKPHASNRTRNRGKAAKNRAELNSSSASRSFTKTPKKNAIKFTNLKKTKKSYKTVVKLTSDDKPTSTKNQGISPKAISSKIGTRPSNFATSPQTPQSAGQGIGKSSRVVFNKEKLQRLLHRVAQSPNFGNLSKTPNGNQLAGNAVAPGNRITSNGNQLLQMPRRGVGRPITALGFLATPATKPANPSPALPVVSSTLTQNNARRKSKKSPPAKLTEMQPSLPINGDGGHGKSLKKSVGSPATKEQMLQSLDLVRAKKNKMQTAVTDSPLNKKSSPVVFSLQLNPTALKEKMKARLNATSTWNRTPITSQAAANKQPTPTLTPTTKLAGEAINSQLLKKKIAERLKQVQNPRNTEIPASARFAELINGNKTPTASPTQPYDLLLSKPVNVGQSQPKNTRVLRWREKSLSRGLAKRNRGDVTTSPQKTPPPPLMTRIDIVAEPKGTAAFNTKPAAVKKLSWPSNPVLSAAALRQKLQSRLITATVAPNVAPGNSISPGASSSSGSEILCLGTFPKPILPASLVMKVKGEPASLKGNNRRGKKICDKSATPIANIPTTLANKQMNRNAAPTVADNFSRTSSAPARTRSGAPTLGERMMDRLKGARFRHINESLYTISGAEAVKFFAKDPEAFELYHEGYQSQVCKWPLHPLDLIIKNIKTMPESVVIADFGCGDARLARSVPHKVHSFDLVALNEHVIACNMEKVPLPNESVNLAVFCLSLMGTNLTAYLMEANRILKMGGLLKIAEVESRFTDMTRFVGNLRDLGFSLLSKDMNHKMFIVMNYVKIGNCTSKVKTNVVLKPCLYKRR